MAKQWVKKEMAWYGWDETVTVGQAVTTTFGPGCIEEYRKSDDSCKVKLDFGYLFCPKHNLHLGSNSEYRPIDNAGEAQVSLEHLAHARTEYASRFAFCTEEEDASSHGFSGSPYLLVATSVDATWTVPEEFGSLKFMLVPIGEAKACALFITCMPGVTHGSVDAIFSDRLGEYVLQHNLTFYVRKCHSGGNTYQPDIRVYPSFPDPTPPPQDQDPDLVNTAYSRLVIQFEYGNRNASELREVGFAALNNDYATLFLGIKIWKKLNEECLGQPQSFGRKITPLVLYPCETPLILVRSN